MSYITGPLVENLQWDRARTHVNAGTTNQVGVQQDMAKFEGIVAVIAFGTLTSSAVTSVEWQGRDSTTASWRDLKGTNTAVADDDDNQFVVTELHRPLQRYVRVQINRGTANAVIDYGFYIRYGKSASSYGQNNASGAAVHYSPEYGTA